MYLYDIIVFSKDHESHLDSLYILSSSIRDAGVSLKRKKFFFFQSRVDYLGHVIQPGKLSVDTDRASAFRLF